MTVSTGGLPERFMPEKYWKLNVGYNVLEMIVAEQQRDAAPYLMAPISILMFKHT
jgi:hypothetical protein